MIILLFNKSISSIVNKLCLTFCNHGLQHARLLCPSLSPRVCSNSCPLSQLCYLTIAFSTVPFSFCLQSFLASESFPVTWLFASGGQSIGASASASASVLPMTIQGWFPLGLTGLISLLSKRLSSLLQHHNSKASIFWCSAFFMAWFSHLYMTTRKNILDPFQPRGLISQCRISFAYSYCSWSSRSKNTGVVCHSLLQGTTFHQNSWL